VPVLGDVAEVCARAGCRDADAAAQVCEACLERLLRGALGEVAVRCACWSLEVAIPAARIELAHLG